MILLTGASGFIGSHLLKILVEKYGNENVVVLTSRPIEDDVCVLHNNFNFKEDIFLQHGLEKIETLIHAGSFTPKNSEEMNNIHLSNLNIRNTEALLNAKLPNLKKLIYLSAIDVYNTDSIITEKSIENPISMYAQSKLYSEKMIQHWGIQNEKTVQLLRIGHVYGPGEESYAKLIPEAFRKVISNQPLKIWGTGGELRSYIYVEDVAEAIVNSITYEENLGVINIVGSQPITTLRLVEKIKYLANSDVMIEKTETDFKGRNLVFDNSKLMNYLLTSETNIEEGLRKEYLYMKHLNN